MSDVVHLVKINNVDFPDPDKGTVTVNSNDLFNTYKTEDGGEVTEQIATGKLSAQVAYKGLFASDIVTLKSAITLVSSVVLYNPMTNTTATINARVTNCKAKIIAYYNNISLWSFSFDISEV